MQGRHRNARRKNPITFPVCTNILHCYRQFFVLASLTIYRRYTFPSPFQSILPPERLISGRSPHFSIALPKCPGASVTCCHPPLVIPPSSWRPHSSRQLAQFNGLLFFPHSRGCNSAAVIGFFLLALRCLPCIALPPSHYAPTYTQPIPHRLHVFPILLNPQLSSLQPPRLHLDLASLFIAQCYPPFSSLVTILVCLDPF